MNRSLDASKGMIHFTEKKGCLAGYIELLIRKELKFPSGILESDDSTPSSPAHFKSFPSYMYKREQRSTYLNCIPSIKTMIHISWPS